MSNLSELKCIPCRGDLPPMGLEEAHQLLAEIPNWEIIIEENIPRLRRTFRFKNFAEALAFTVKVGEIAEVEGHHPTLITEWGKTTVVWWTHAIRGLHQNDFIMASKVSALYETGRGRTGLQPS